MEFITQLEQFSGRVANIKDSIKTEEATKMSLIVPFFQLLGYDVFNSSEFCPEFTADVGIKKGEKVDYAVLHEGKPTILIECKWCGETLDKHSSQLFRYFATTEAKFGILTNGINYRFYTDLDEANKMDLVPFLEIDLLNLKEPYISELKKFCKDSFDSENISSTASELKYTKMIKEVLQSEFSEPSDEFIKFILGKVYDGQKTQKAIEYFKNIIKKSYTGFINDIVNQKITAALTPEDAEEEPEVAQPVSKIITTEEEVQAFYIIRAILSETVNIEDIHQRDTESYFGILYKDNNRKPICRLNLDTKNKQLFIPDKNKSFTRYYINDLNDIYKYKEQLIEVAKFYS